MSHAWSLAAMLILLALAGCGAPDVREADPPLSTEVVPRAAFLASPSLPAAGAVQASNDFAFRLHRALATGDGNAFHSPHSIRTAFAMLLEGARGPTAQEIAAGLDLPTDPKERQTVMAQLHAWLARPASGVQFDQANGAWVDASATIRNEFATALEVAYGATAKQADFRSDAEAERAGINAWVSGITHGLIPDLFPPGSLSSDTVLALVNAIYFNGTWANEFNSTSTQAGTFHAPTGGVQAQFMRRTGSYAYAERDGLQAVRLPYRGGNMSMLVLLPPEGGMTALETALDGTTLDGWRKSLVTREVRVEFPKFELAAKYPRLGSALDDLGIRRAFTPSADLSGIAGSPGDLLVATAVHQAVVKVDERGTEAAAATGIGVGTTSVPPPPPVFRADRPFLFIIQDDESGTILFMGRLADPSA